MPFYIRKSLSFGPLRFNLSNSGIGVSAGVKGFRVGTGPRGNYIQAGRGGIYYRATLPGGSPRSRSLTPSPRPDEQSTVESMVEIGSADTASMIDANSTLLLAELNQKYKLMRFWPITLILGLSLFGIGMAIDQTAGAVLGVILGLGAIPTAYWDQHRKTTVLFYNLEEPVLPAVENLHTALDQVRDCGRVSVIEAEGLNSNLKYHAGAGTSVRRRSVSLQTQAPPYFKTNIAVFCIPTGRNRLYFFPDRILAYDGHSIGAISYGDMTFHTTQTRFVENEGVPGDARVVDRTWQYVNKGGGPDRRFSYNPELPIVLYEELWLHSSSGLNEKLQISRIGVSAPFTQAIQDLATALAMAPTLSPIVPDASISLADPQEVPELDTQPQVLQDDAITTTESEPPPAGDLKYFYFDSGVHGPYTLSQLSEFCQTGSINSETQVCSEDDNRWLPYNQFLSGT